MKKFIIACAAFFAAFLFCAAAMAAPETAVTVPYGDWLSGALQMVAPAALTAIALAVRSLAPPIVRTFLTDKVVEDAVNYAFSKVGGAVKGKTLDVPVANEVGRVALGWLVSHEPDLVGKIGDRLGGLIVAKISQLGSGPAGAIATPKTP